MTLSNPPLQSPEPPARRSLSLAQALLVTLPAALIVAVVEALSAALGTTTRLVTFASTLAFLSLFAFGMGLGSAIVLWLGVRMARAVARRRPLAFGPGHRGIDLLAALLLTLPLFAVFAYAAALFSATSFKNHELASLQLTAWLVLAALAATTATLALVVASAAIRSRIRHGGGVALVLAPGALLLAATALVLLLHNRSGLGQLGSWMLAELALLPPLLGLGLLAAWRLAPGRAWLWTALGLAAVSLPLSTATAWLAPGLGGTLTRSGGLSRYLVRGIRAASDFDADGYSSLLGGGDCAPFDPATHPGARDLPGDGIDSNCVGGDARPLAGPTHPRWFPPPPQLPNDMNLVVVTVETVRADRVGFLGHDRPTTPQLSRLAQSSVVFERMFSASSATRLALPALMSSLTPSHIHWIDLPYATQMRQVHPSNPWMPSILKSSGYVTIAVLTNFRAFTQTERAGFDRGFTHYDTSTRLKYTGGTMHGFPGEDQVDKAIEYVDRYKSRKFFLWMHLMEPHFAYERAPDAPDFGSEELDRYDSEIWKMDEEIGRLVAHLKKRKLLDRTVFLFTGDHGEEFGEHGARWHNTNLFQPQIHTAALLRVPAVEPRRVEQVVTHTDFAPTLLNLLGLESGFMRMRGRNLTPLLFGNGLEPSPLVLELFEVHEGKNYMAALVDWPLKLIYRQQGNEWELYDLGRDGAEKYPLPPRGDPDAARLESLMREYLDSKPR